MGLHGLGVLIIDKGTIGSGSIVIKNRRDKSTAAMNIVSIRIPMPRPRWIVCSECISPLHTIIGTVTKGKNSTARRISLRSIHNILVRNADPKFTICIHSPCMRTSRATIIAIIANNPVLRSQCTRTSHGLVHFQGFVGKGHRFKGLFTHFCFSPFYSFSAMPRDRSFSRSCLISDSAWAVVTS